MGEIVNLRTVRKQRKRAAADVEARAARTKHGRSKVEIDQARTEAAKAERHLDGHRRGDA